MTPTSIGGALDDESTPLAASAGGGIGLGIRFGIGISFGLSMAPAGVGVGFGFGTFTFLAASPARVLTVFIGAASARVGFGFGTLTAVAPARCLIDFLAAFIREASAAAGFRIAFGIGGSWLRPMQDPIPRTENCIH